jgi:phage-related protein
MSDVGAVKYKVELDDSGIDQEAKKSESKIASAFGGAAGAVKSTVSTALKVGTAAVAAGSTAVVGLVKTASDAYGDFQQLTGGIETLFGDAAGSVMSNAEQAFKTAGMSMNDYMETSIQSAAAMINSLGGDQAKAAELMDLSITDMADNVNKMGTDMEAVQNAYRGFSRGNFSMLDNLALGFAGSKDGMQQLLDKAKELSGVEYDISSYSDIVEAIHVVQTEMGITGTTAEEASSTLQGSLSSMQAAWENLATGLADPDADIGALIGQMVDSAQTFLDNLLPIAQQALTSIISAIGEAAPVLADTVIPMIVDLIPDLISAGMQLAGAVGQGLVDAAPDLAFAAFDIIEMLLNSMLDATQTEGPGAITEILDWIIGIFDENYVGLVDTGLQIINNLLNGMTEALPVLLSYIPDIIGQLSRIIISNAPMLIKSAAELIVQLALGIAQALPDLIPAAVDCILTIVEALTDPDTLMMLVDAAIELTIALAEGLINALPKLIEKAPVIIENLVTALVKAAPKLAMAALQVIVELTKAILLNLPKIVQAGWQIITSVIKGIGEYLSKLPEYGKQVINMIWDGIKSLDPVQWGKDMIQSFIDGIMGMISSVGDAVGRVADTVKSFLGFSEPEKGPLSNFHTFPKDMVDLYAQGIEDNAYKVADAAEGLAGDIAMGFNSDINYNVPDLAGYAADLSASITGTGQTRIEVPVVIDGREVARASAWYMGEQLAWEAR